jgi:hypothetical protein
MPPNAAEHFYESKLSITPETDQIVQSDRFRRTMDRNNLLRIHLTTFNCAALPHPRYPISLPELPPDLIVLGLQEIAPPGDALLNLSVIEDHYLKGLESITEETRKRYGEEYELKQVVRIGPTGLAIWSNLGRRLKKIMTASAACGLLGLLANKGGVAARLTYCDGNYLWSRSLTSDRDIEREVTFTVAHLAAQEDYFDRRNQDFRTLVQNLVFADHTGILKPRTPLFFLGDLNYRISALHPSRSTSKVNRLTQQLETIDETASLLAKLKDSLTDFLQTGKFLRLVPHDQLLLSPLALYLTEQPITFSPTYKFVSYNPPKYAAHRTPSWTDRILYTPRTIQATEYRAVTSESFSDHQAVSLDAVLRAEDFEGEDGLMPWDINPNWRERRELGEKLGYLAGMAEYMGETKVGLLVLAAIVGPLFLYWYL